METDETIQLAPLGATASLPAHFPPKGFRSKMQFYHIDTQYQDENICSMNRIASRHRPLKSHYHQHTYTEAREDCAQCIVDKLEQDDDLMEDTPIAEMLRKETLRELPQCLTIKRCVKAKLSKSINLKSKHKRSTFRQELRFRWNKFKVKLSNWATVFELWHNSLRRIEGQFGSSYASYFKFLRYLFILNLFMAVLMICFIIAPQIVHDLSHRNRSVAFKFHDLFTGNGYFYDTILYYGHYTDQYIQFYNMPIAYFSVMSITYLIAFIFLSVSVATSYRRNFIETEGGFKNAFANKIFCSWDYGIATKRAAKLQSDTIYHEIKELLQESLQYGQERSLIYTCYTRVVQIIVNLLIILSICGIGYGLWILLDQYSFNTDDLSVVPAVIVNLILMILPVVFSEIAKYENYRNPRITLYITLTRTYLLGIVVTGVTVLFWLFNDLECWETALAQEIYRLTIFDFIFSIIIKSSFTLLSFVINRNRGLTRSAIEFNIATNTLEIIYNQTLLLIGLLYSPVLSIIIVTKLFIIFYIRDISIRRLCRPPQHSWRAAQTNTYFLLITFITNVLVLALHGYTVTRVETSTFCGPFQQNRYMYNILTNGNQLEKRILFYMTKPWIVTLFIIGLSIYVYSLKARAEAQRDKVKLLRKLLVWSAKDKKILVEHIRATTGGLDLLTQPHWSFDGGEGDI